MKQLDPITRWATIAATELRVFPDHERLPLAGHSIVYKRANNIDLTLNVITAGPETQAGLRAERCLVVPNHGHRFRQRRKGVVDTTMGAYLNLFCPSNQLLESHELGCGTMSGDLKRGFLA